MRTTPATTAKAARPPPAIKAEDIFSSLLLVETSIFGSIAQTLDFPSWSTETPLSTDGVTGSAVVGSSEKMAVRETMDDCATGAVSMGVEEADSC